MKITKGVRQNAQDSGIVEEKALKMGIEVKFRELIETSAEGNMKA